MEAAAGTGQSYTAGHCRLIDEGTGSIERRRHPPVSFSGSSHVFRFGAMCLLPVLQPPDKLSS